MKCKNCGKENEAGARFCSRCGVELSAENVINTRNNAYDRSGYRPDSSNSRYEKHDYSFHDTEKSSVVKWKIPIAIIISLIIFTAGLFIFRVFKEPRSDSGNSSKNKIVSDVTETSDRNDINENSEASDSNETYENSEASDSNETDENSEISDDTEISENTFENEQEEQEFTADDIRENADEVWEIVTSNDQFNTIYVGYYESEDRSTAGVALFKSVEEGPMEFTYADGKVSREINKDGSENVVWNGDGKQCVMEKKGSELILEVEGEKFTLSKTNSIDRYIKVHDSLVAINNA